jgi:hypothetical protein
MHLGSPNLRQKKFGVREEPGRSRQKAIDLTNLKQAVKTSLLKRGSGTLYPHRKPSEKPLKALSEPAT